MNTKPTDERYYKQLSLHEWGDLLLDYESSDPGSENRSLLRNILAYRLSRLEAVLSNYLFEGDAK